MKVVYEENSPEGGILIKDMVNKWMVCYWIW